MSINALFPGHEVFRHPGADVPSIWEHLISLPSQQALNWVTDCLGLTESSKMANAVRSATDLGIVAPRRERDRTDPRMWTLAILYAPRRALLFDCPTPDFLHSPLELPAEYVEIVTKLGSLRFDQYAGDLIWPAGIDKIAQDISLFMADSTSVLKLVPFFDHHTGDFDCWIDREFDTSFVFNHESCDLQKYCDGGFTGWMQRRFEENLNL